MKEYYSELWNFRHGVHQVNLKDLPSTLIEEFMYDVCEEMFNTSPLFRDLESNTLHSISRLAKVKLYIPEALIIREGDYSTDMYYVIQGELGVRGKVDAENMALILRPGSILGEVNLLYSIPAHSTIQTMTTCQILKIPKQGFMKAMEKHPMDLAIIRQRLGVAPPSVFQMHNFTVKAISFHSYMCRTDLRRCWQITRGLASSR